MTSLDGRYRLISLLKAGRGVETHLARDVIAGTPVVLKLLRAGESAPGLVRRLEHEASVLLRLKDSSFPLLHFGRVGDDLYLVQPYLPGRSLAEVLAEGPLSVADTLIVASALLAELRHAHDLGVLHRDVKPANVILDGAEPVRSAVLVDFGLSFSASLDPEVRGEAVGTARYVAPEQAGLIDAVADQRSDLYSLGAVLYECLAGRPPFEGSDVGEVLRRHLNSPVPGLRASGVEVPRALESVILRLLAKEPGKRYQTAAGALADVEQISAGLAAGVSDPSLVIGLKDRRTVLAEPAFVGRAQELATLSEHLNLAARGRPGLVFVAAESGGGKTRLLQEFAGEASASGVWILRGQGVDQAAQRPYQLLEGVAEGIARAVEADPGTGELLRSRMGDRAGAAATALPRLAAVLGHEPAGNLPEAHGEVRSLTALQALLRATGTAEKPALVLLDDCQWTDGLTAKLLEQWRTQASTYVLVVAAFRSEDVGPGHPLRRVSPDAEISLRPLTPPEVASLTQSMAGPLPSEVVQTVTQLSEGSPFMAAAVILGLVESEAVYQSASGWEVNAQALADAQTSRRAAIFLARRLEQLSPEALRLLSVGAVLGKEFELALAGSLTGLEEAGVLPALAEARRRRIVWVDEEKNRCHFVHDKIRETLLDTLAPADRTALHLAAAEHLESLDRSRIFELAYHFDAAGATSRALPYALASAEHARKQHTLEIAEAHYRMALRSAPEDRRPVRRQVNEGLGDVLTLQGTYEEAVVQFGDALALCDDRVDRARLQGKLGDVAFKQGDMVEARRHLERAIRQLRARMPRSAPGVLLALVWEVVIQALHTVVPRLFVGRRTLEGAAVELQAVRIYSRLAYVYWFHSGKIRCGWAHLREMNLAERYPPTLELAQAYSEHAPVMTMIPWFSRGLDYVERSLAIRTDLGDLWGEGQSLSFAGVGLYAASRYREAIDRCTEAKRLMERTGDRWEVNTAGWNIAFAQYRLGELTQAIETARSVHEHAVAIGDQAAAGIALSAWSRASNGQVPASLLAAQLERPELEDASTNVEVLLAEAVRLLGAGELEEAVAVLRRARAIVRKAGLRQEYVAPILPWMATALRMQAEAVSAHSAVPRRQMFQAVQAAHQAARMARNYRNNLPHALREQGLLAALDGRHRAAGRHLVASLQAARLQGARYEEALSLEAYGRVGRPLGWERAAEHLRAGQDLLAELRGDAAAESNPDTLSLADRFTSLVAIARSIASASEREGVYTAVREAAATLLRGEQSVVVDMHGRVCGDIARIEQLANLSQAMAEQAIQEGRPVVVNLGDGLDASESLVLSGVRSVLCAPITSKDGSTSACFYVTHSQVGGLFDGDEVQLASFIATLAGAALDQVAGSEARFTSLAQNSSDVISIVGAGGLVDYQSASVQRVFGLPPGQMMGSRLAEWIHPADSEAVLETLRRMSGDGEHHALREFRVRAHDGSWRWTETTLTNLLDDPSVHGVVLNTRDVTERKHMEAARRRDEEALRLSQAQLAAAQRIGHFGSFHWDVEGNVLDWSDELHNIMGVGKAGFGRSIDDYRARIHPEDARMVEDILTTALAEGGDFEMEHRIVRPDGEPVVLSCRGEVITGANGRPELIIGVAQDVTERKRVEQALRVSEDRARAAMDQAVEASRMKSQFLATMSHEIRTPMNGVLGMAHLLLDTKLSASQRRYLLALKDSGTNLLEIINDILDFSKVEAGKLELERIGFDLRHAVRSAASMFTATAEAKGLDLAVSVSPGSPAWVAGDPVRLRQVLANLLSNAVKFTDAGRVSLDVRDLGDGRIRFEVADTGVGIDPSVSRNVLDPFVQADASTTRRYGGTGLGLAISRQLVELMGGSLGFESSSGSGTTFWFEIPLPAAQTRREEAPAPQVDPPPESPSAGRVLLVEDSQVNQLVATGMLEKLGYQVDVCDNGAEAVEKATDHRYDVILMDCRMPVMDGYEATRHIRRREGAGVRTPIIALTASAMAGDRERCLDAGMDGYLSKPLDPRELAATLGRRVEEPAAGDFDPPAAAEEPEVLDRSVLDGLRQLDSGGDGAFLRAVVAAFLSDTPLRIADLHSGIEEMDSQRVSRAAHTLKGSSRNIGAARLASLCERLEKTGASADPSSSEELLGEIQAELVRVERALAAEIRLAS